MRYCFVFVCQQGDLEIKALLLATSLRHHLRCDHDLIAAIPAPVARWGKPSAAILGALARLGCDTRVIQNPIGADYPIGNKLACLSLQTEADKLVFVDSDVLCLRPFAGAPQLEVPGVCAKPADLPTYGRGDSAWAAAYRSVGLAPPTRKVFATVDGAPMPPYFNAGFIAVTPALRLGKAWITAARAIDADPLVPDKRPWLDQIALPVAAARLGLKVMSLDESFNYPAHLKPIDTDRAPFFLHYHYPEVLRAEPMANALVVKLAAQVPALAEAMHANPLWRPLLQPYAALQAAARQAPRPHPHPARHSRGSTDPATPSATAQAPTMIITGIPRSGTSYLCALLNGLPDCVLVNEPAEVFEPLIHEQVPWGLALLYRSLRMAIREGQPIQNKLRNGEFIEDTAQADTREDYVPAISRQDFLLGTKNTLAYMARLPHLRRAMPTARIVACIRNPFDTIASWKATFPHLRDAALEDQRLGHSRDPFLLESQREALAQIAAEQCVMTRRAMAWRYLAGELERNADVIALVRYEDLTSGPRDVIRSLLATVPGMFSVDDLTALHPSSPRARAHGLDEKEVEIIRSVCGPIAERFGYQA